jgi:hypothetical protein
MPLCGTAMPNTIFAMVLVSEKGRKRWRSIAQVPGGQRPRGPWLSSRRRRPW